MDKKTRDKEFALLREFAEAWGQMDSLDLFEKKLSALSAKCDECSFAESQNELICRFFPDGTITYVNNAYCKYFMREREDIIGNTFKPFATEEDARLIEQHLALLSTENPSIVYEHRFIIPGRDAIDVRWLRWTGKALLDGNGQMAEIQTVGWDVTENKMLEEKLRENEDRLKHLAHFDVLTGLSNRTYFNSRLAEEVSRCKRYDRRLVVMFLDLDNFKKINDSLGHDVGDLLLKEVSQRIGICLRDTDIVSRLGGDEFTVILTELAKDEDAALAAQRIIDAVSRPFILRQHEFYVTVSIGMAVYPLDGENGDTMVKNADTAMYYAKSQGRNNYQFYSAQMNAAHMERLTIESQLRKAVENREFVLFYQPQISIQTGHIIGAEALIRWIHPVKGMIPPMKFIPVAEETGLIIPISEWVIMTACEQNKRWKDEGFPPLTVAVNISMRHFMQPNLLDVIAEALQKTGLPSPCLELELTESIVMHNVDEVIRILQKFRETGVQSSIDDFGTGYSSLNYLKRLPINKLKIDQSFVRNITADQNDAMIVKTVIEMAHNLGLRVIAEGVETSDQVNFLRTLACDELQGYFFSKPLPAEEFIQLLEVFRMIS
jgi:diguanylate cyclase (GGDEF)-like protein/PAS domain S-box-containing protein